MCYVLNNADAVAQPYLWNRHKAQQTPYRKPCQVPCWHVGFESEPVANVSGQYGSKLTLQ